MERGHVLWTMLILLSLYTVFTEAYPAPLARLAGTLVASGRCDTEHVRAHKLVCCFSGETAAERKLYTHRVRERQVSVWKGEHVCQCVCVRDRERE